MVDLNTITAYCWKCGAKLAEDAKFCHVCGAPLSRLTAETGRRTEERVGGFTRFIVFALIAVLVIALAFAGVSFFSYQPMDYNEFHKVDIKPDIRNLNLSFTADVANVDITFADLGEELITFNVTASGRMGLFASSKPLDIKFDDTIVNDVLVINSKIGSVSQVWPPQAWLTVNCSICINPSLKANIDISTSVGEIVLVTQSGVVLNSLSLQAVTGKIQVKLIENATMLDDISVKTTTGGVEFSWDNVNTPRNVLVELKTTTGGVSADVRQIHTLGGNVTLNAETTTGGVDFTLDIQGEVGAMIVSKVTTGGIDVSRKTGFSGANSLLQSNNYPDRNNFNVDLQATTGGIGIDVEYTQTQSY